MIIVGIKHISLYIFIVFIYSIILFCYGFFPLSFSPATKSDISNLPGSIDNVKLNPEQYKSRHSKIVSMIIDALRTDFTTEDGNMKFLNELITNGTACKYKLQVHPPTVTMPRIKAMTSGAIPSFLDVVLNLGSPEMTLDTFLYQMVRQRQNIVFYGDNTWTKMFPAMFLRKGENVDSLYVNDFYEGDRNVTDKMRSELNNYDWKLMILHFLGLDHIGHVEGPFSDKVPTKLHEMDNVISEIYQAMKIWDNKFHTKSLLIITGDHGMRDSGGHGGSTFPETHVPLVVVGNNCSKCDETYLQIDLAPTFATMLGVPIPYSSIGSLIQPLLSGAKPMEKLYAVHYNTKRLIDKVLPFYDNNIKQQDFFILYQDAKLLHAIFLEDSDDETIAKKAIDKYVAASQKLTKILIKNYIRYDMFSIMVGIILGISTTTVSVLLLLLPQDVEMIQLGVKSLTWVPMLIVVIACKHFLASHSTIDSSLLKNSYISHICAMAATCCLYVNWSIFRSSLALISRRTFPEFKLRSLGLLLLIGSIFHVLSLSSSSFIEEEHQTWYYITNSLFLMLAMLELRIMNRTIVQISSSQMHENLLVHCRRERQEFCIGAVCFLAAHIALRRWNQTGDKWQHIPDVGDWLGRTENKFWLSLVLFFGLCFVLIALGHISGFLTTILSMTACLLIYYYRLMTGVVSLFGVVPSRTTGCLTIFWINLWEIFFIGFLPKIYRALMGKPALKTSQMLISVISVTVLLSSLIHKPHNVILTAALLSSSQYIVKRIDHIADSKSENLILKIVFHIWLGKMFYFYQGNSNNLATVDLNAGYVGLDSFDFVRVGMLLTLNTFNGQILSYLMLIYHLTKGCQNEPKSKGSKLEHNQTHILQSLLKWLNVQVIVPLIFYIVIATLMRNHIFVWTVFSPKIIYDCFFLSLTMLQMLAAYFMFNEN
ncbi:GPI ethanolamine phosphate transferase 2 [Toxorhynchites rutilus septentrionalis]|uniref:GPI ethanolamine phosphate transferase 2 n=1 Tax=Toxorhynchites rutilus septentrionalis TaxID=329112 RepID=UPI0024790B4E|nr:GPI ethanolamine phosphate transferase 2 [Toxorhynchites rutilus septentrionalis]